jgi:polyhydroxybutyrate depolymerase
MLTALALVVLAAPKVETYSVDGVARRTLVFSNGGTNKPLVLAFHGHGGNMGQAARSFRMQLLWPEALVIYPEGLPSKGIRDPNGTKNGWQKNPGELADRDLKLVDAILERHKKSFDATRVYAMGHSNGGRFTYLLWATRPAVFAAYGPSGSPATGLGRLEPRSAFIVAGRKDPLVPFAGQKRTIDALIEQLKSPRETKTIGFFEYVREAPSGLEIGTYIQPGGHEYPRAVGEATVAFFKRHSR